MKDIKTYINESGSLFDSGYTYNVIAQNYLEYEDGDKKFGELQSGDIIYMYNYNSENIIEITVKGKISKRDNKIYISTEPFKLIPNAKYSKSSKIEFGPAYGGRMGADDGGAVRDYSPENIEKSSICISFGGGYAFGTNKETVLKYAKGDIAKSIQKIQDKINNLQKEIESLNKKFKNIN